METIRTTTNKRGIMQTILKATVSTICLVILLAGVAAVWSNIPTYNQ